MITEICEIAKPARILELGSWMGESAIQWVNAAKKFNQNPKVYCIDTWLGSVEHYLNSNVGWGIEKLRFDDYGPDFFDTFLANIHHAGLEKSILPLRADTRSALPYLANNRLKYDLVYIDASHEWYSVYLDFLQSTPLLTETGVICGDDFGWPSVRRGLAIATLRCNFNGMQKYTFFSKGTYFVAVPRGMESGFQKIHKQLSKAEYKKWRPLLPVA